MKSKHIIPLLLLFLISGIFSAKAQNNDTLGLKYPIKSNPSDPYSPKNRSSNVNLKDPANVTSEVEYDPKTNQYIIRKKAGNFEYTAPYTMSFEEYQKYDVNRAMKSYWKERYQSESFEHQSSLIPKINVGGQVFETIFGSSTIDIRPRGSASLKFGIKIDKTENPNRPVNMQTNTTFDFQEQIQMDVSGKIGDNLELKLSYNTESQFDFDNKMNIRYQGKEDDILQKLEAGDVSMPLTTSLISGSQSLFGVLTELKFGKLYLTTLLSQQEGESKTINVEGGAQKNEFEIEAVDYDKNRHFLFSHYFRSHYDESLKNLPIVPTSINIRKVEVWTTQKKYTTEDTRAILALTDLGEETPYAGVYGERENTVYDESLGFFGSRTPSNKANSLYENISSLSGIRNVYSATSALNSLGYQGGKHYEKLEAAVLLDPGQYKINTKLGYISLNNPLNADEVLGIAFEYTINGSDSTVYKVGEFANEVADGGTVIVKLIKGTNLSPALPNWNLMMKNIYSIGAYSLNQEDFIMEVEYYHDATGTKVFNFPDNRFGSMKYQKLLNILNLDNMDSQGNPISGGDGVFDFVDNYTITRNNGRIIFPVLEPFGGHLADKIKQLDISSNDQRSLIKEYTFQELYDSTQYKAEQITSKNKYFLSGTYKSAGGSEIYLNAFNIPQGSVKVTAGGNKLVENNDYTVDYNMGRVKILNESLLASGTPIKITLESQSLISVKSKTLIGAHADYRFSDNFNLGATYMNLTERPQTAKVNQGDEPISNSIMGLNGSFRTEAPFLTKAVDLLPFIETKEKSSITFEGEVAYLAPGHNKAIEATGNKESAYVEDFEGSESSIPLNSTTDWQIASIPQLFKESQLFDSLATGYNRAKLSWYSIDNFFYDESKSPVSSAKLSNLKSYRVREQDLYPNKETKGGIPNEIATFDLAYFPNERGMYNYETFEGAPGISSGLNEDGTLKNPESRWAGIMKSIPQSDFESQNIEYLEFWVMDPFVDDSKDSKGGYIYFNLGNVSEDILKDSRKSYEQGLPVNQEDLAYIDETNWSRVPTRPVLSQSFDPDPNNRKYQDVGLDGYGNSASLAGDGVNDEALAYSSFLFNLRGKLTVDAFNKISEDPSSDNFVHFRSSDKDITVVERYKNYNNHEGNSASNKQQTEDYLTTAAQLPDMEDINKDNTLSETEAYYQYKIWLNKNEMQIGQNFITDKQTTVASFANEDTAQVTWYQFRIPINQPEKVVGGINDFRSIRFVRMFLTGWDKNVVLRFAKLELVRSEWRQYKYAIQESDEQLAGGEDESNAPFSTGSVNIEENSHRSPVNYVLPPDVDRQLDNYSGQAYKQNEQAMSLRVDKLEDGFSRAVYKNINMDMRDYGALRMFVHAESLETENEIDNNDITCFIRLGSDFTNNYYEYEVPLAVTPKGNYGDSEDQRRMVWPESNNMDIVFEDLIQLKEKRNGDPSLPSLLQRYSVIKGKNRITIKGNPSLSMVKTVMIGIRNPDERFNSFDSKDDGREKSAIVWVNELRLTDFDEKGGWAATGRMTARMADFGSLSLAGSTTQPGFGSIEQKGPERAKEETNQVDIASNFELGKFFPKEANVRLPMYIGYSRTSINPEYNPLDQDVLLDRTLKNDKVSDAEKEILVNKVQDLTERRSINFTNIGVGGSGKGKPKFYSPSNLSATYVYNETTHHDVGTEYNNNFNQSGSINYVFNNQPENIKPLSKVKLFKKPIFSMLRDFNFYYMPSQISYRTGVDTRYNESLLRNLNNPAQKYTPYYNHQFSWDRKFDLKYSLTRNLKLDYSYSNRARGQRDTTLYVDSYDAFKEKVKDNIFSGGQAMQFSQQFDANYTIPINKIKFLSWISSTATYGSTYDWKKGPDVLTDSLDPQNNIVNSQKIMLRAQLNMGKLYTEMNYFKELEKKYKQPAAQRNKPKIIDVEYIKENVRFNGIEAKTISHGLKTEDQIEVKITRRDSSIVEAAVDIVDKNKISITLKTPTEDRLIVKVTGKREKYDSPFLLAFEYTMLAATGFKQVSADVSQNRALAVYGLNSSATGENHTVYTLFGSNRTGLLRYSFGDQFGAYNDFGEPFIKELMDNGYLMTNQTLIQPFASAMDRTWNAKATYQPINDLRVDFTGKYTEGRQYSAYYTMEDGKLVHQSPEESGSFNMNIWMLSTAFDRIPSAENYKSGFINDYKQNYREVAQRHANARQRAFSDYQAIIGENGLPVGYNWNMPDVAIPAFMATFSDKKASNIPLNFKSWKNFRPSWRAKFDGLAKTELFKKYFRSISFNHGYQNTLTVGNYKSNTRFFSSDYKILDDIYYSNIYNELDSAFVSKYDMSSFTVSEQFLPMIGIDMTWKKGIISKFEYKRTRAMTMTLTNNQLTEVYTWEFVIGSGYRIDNLPIHIGRLDAKNNLNLRGDLSIRDNVTVSRNIAQEQENITAGQKIFTLKFTADYQLSEKLQAQLYFNNQINTPKMSTAFRTANTEFGFSLRFSLTQ